MSMPLPSLTTLIALLLSFATLVNVARARIKFKIAAPAVSVAISGVLAALIRG